MADRGWKRSFDEPIPLPRGRKLVTLQDAGNYITKLPKAELKAAEWQAAMEALILVATLGGLTMGPKDPQQKTRRREPAGPFGEQCSSADLDGTNPPAVPRQHALPHDVAAAVVTVVAVVVVVRIVVVIGVRPGADEEHPPVVESMMESGMETARCKARAGSDRGDAHSAAVPGHPAAVPTASAAVPGHAAAVPTSSATAVPAASATAVETTASAKAASVTTAAASVAATTATTAS